MKKRSKKSIHSKKKTSACRLPKSPGAEPLSEQKFRDLFDLTHDMIQIFKTNGTLLECNPSWQKNLEYNGCDLAHLSFLNVLSPKDKKDAEEVFLAVLRDGKPRKFRAILISKSGREVAVKGVVGRFTCGERPSALFAVFHNVTRNKHYEQLKNEFVSTVSHELRTPLTVVREGVAQIRDELMGAVPENQKSMLNMVLQNSDRLGRIIEELLDVSKLEAGKVHLRRKLYNITEVASEVAGNFRVIAEQRGLEIRTNFSAAKIEIYIDRDKIAQVLTNLISNALKFTEKGYVMIHLSARDGFVECKVSDTGKGISKEDLPRAFQKFQQFRREVGPGDRGTGLGLSICRKLVELHHGRVRIESVPMKGTVVTFHLPQYTHRDFFRDAIDQARRRCEEEKSPLSVIIFNLLDFEVLEKKLGVKRMERIVHRIEKIINNALRRVADVAIKDTKSIVVLLPDTQKENAYIVKGRLSQIIEDYLIQEQKTPKVEVHSNVVCFPEEANTLEGILEKIYA